MLKRRVHEKNKRIGHKRYIRKILDEFGKVHRPKVDASRAREIATVRWQEVI